LLYLLTTGIGTKLTMRDF